MTDLKSVREQNEALRGAEIITYICELSGCCDWCGIDSMFCLWYNGFGKEWRLCRECESAAVRYFDAMTELRCYQEDKKREALRVEQLRLFVWVD